MSDPDFVHRFEPAPGDVDAATAPVLLLLHGTGGNEDDLLELGRGLAPGAHLLSPRGKVLENGMPRFFRRLSEGVFDLDDLRRRTGELADFVTAAADKYNFDAARVVALGYSNGANIAAALLLLRPTILSGAVLLRAMVPLEPEEMPDLSGKSVLLETGQFDPIVPSDNADRLATLLYIAGAEVTHQRQPSGHALTGRDIAVAQEWLADLWD